MIKMMELILENMDISTAVSIFKKYGVKDPIRMGGIELNKEWKELVKKYHPDRGGDTRTMQWINAAYDVLKIKGNNRDMEDNNDDGKEYSFMDIAEVADELEDKIAKAYENNIDFRNNFKTESCAEFYYNSKYDSYMIKKVIWRGVDAEQYLAFKEKSNSWKKVIIVGGRSHIYPISNKEMYDIIADWTDGSNLGWAEFDEEEI